MNYNDYLAENGGVVSHATCQLALKATDVHRITENTPLIRLVSHEDEDTGNDWLYIVVTDIVSIDIIKHTHTHINRVGKVG